MEQAMKYVEFAKEIDKHFAAIQKMVNGLKPTDENDTFDCDKAKGNLLLECITLNHKINNELGTYLESE